MKNQILAYMREHSTVRVIPVDSPVVMVNTSTGDHALPLETRVGTFNQIIDDMTKHSVVYLYEAEVYQSDLIKLRWGWVE